MSTVNHHQQYLHIQNMDPEFNFQYLYMRSEGYSSRLVCVSVHTRYSGSTHD